MYIVCKYWFAELCNVPIFAYIWLLKMNIMKLLCLICTL